MLGTLVLAGPFLARRLLLLRILRRLIAACLRFRLPPIVFFMREMRDRAISFVLPLLPLHFCLDLLLFFGKLFASILHFLEVNVAISREVSATNMPASPKFRRPWVRRC